jgi:hypothetical protein
MTVDSGGIRFNGSGLAGTNTASTGANFAWTVNSSGISINGSNIAGTTTAITGNASITLNSAGLQFNGSNLAGVNTGATNASITVNSSGVSISVNPSTASTFQGGISTGGNTAGSTGVVQQRLVFVGSNGITLSGSTDAALNSGTITILGNVPPIMSRLFYPDNMLSQVSAPGNGSVSVQMVQLQENLSGSRIEGFFYQSISSSAVGNTYGQQWSVYAMILTNDTANNRLMSLSSGSTQTTYTLASNTAGQTQILGSGIRPISCPVNFSMTPGVYFVAFNVSTNTFSSGTASTALNRTVSIMGGAQLQSASYAMVADYSAATAATNNSFKPMGVLSNGATAGIPATISYSQITMTGASVSQANIALMFRNN